MRTTNIAGYNVTVLDNLGVIGSSPNFETERQWRDHQPQPEIHLQQRLEAAVKPSVHRRKPLQGHRNAG